MAKILEENDLGKRIALDSMYKASRRKKMYLLKVIKKIADTLNDNEAFEFTLSGTVKFWSVVLAVKELLKRGEIKGVKTTLRKTLNGEKKLYLIKDTKK